MKSPYGQKFMDRQRNAVEDHVHPNTVTAVIHAIPGDDGGSGIVRHLSTKNQALALNGSTVGKPLSKLVSSSGDRFIVEGPHPLTAAQIVSRAGIPPHMTTHVLLILPGSGGLYELDTTNALIAPIVYANQPTALAIGDISQFSPEDRGTVEFIALTDKTQRLISYLESKYYCPVMFIATGPYTIVDREPARRRK